MLYRFVQVRPPERVVTATREEHARAALALIETTAKWYADNPHRSPQEVDHALCVEILDLAQRGLDGGELPGSEAGV